MGAVDVARAGESIAAAAIVVLYGALAVAAAGPVLRAPLRSLLALGGLVVVGAAYLWVYGVTLIVAGVFGAATIGACLLWPLRGAWALFLVTVLAVAAGAAVDVGTYTGGLAHDRALDLRMILAFVLAVGGVSSVVDIAVGALRGALRREREQQTALDREAAAHRALEVRLAHAEDDARRRLAQELHDDIGQQMTALRLALGLVPFATDDGDARARLLEASVLAGDLAGRVALLASGRHPERLQRDGLATALGALFAGLGRQAGLAVEVDVPAAWRPVEPDAEFALYRIAQEALNNVIRHAGASRIAVALHQSAGGLRLTIEDDGRGFDVDAARRRSSAGGTLGLAGMRTRAESLGGTVSLEAAPGRGARLVVDLPARAAGHAA